MQSLRPTGRQVYAIAAELCALHGEPFPATAAEASELIEHLRRRNGHPAPRLADNPLPPLPPWLEGGPWSRRRRRARRRV